MKTTEGPLLPYLKSRICSPPFEFAAGPDGAGAPGAVKVYAHKGEK